MELYDRQNILLNIEPLMRYTEYNELMDICIRTKLLFIEMKEQIELHPDERTRHRKLIEKITHRGPKAFHHFKNILKLAFPQAATFLDRFEGVF
jgi:hypothetical protein